jgi:hypothetical protein
MANNTFYSNSSPCVQRETLIVNDVLTDLPERGSSGCLYTQRKRQQSQQARVQDHNGINEKRKPRKETKEI